MSDAVLNSLLEKVQRAREAIEVEYEDKLIPDRMMRAHDGLQEAAVILLNQKGNQ